MVRCKDHLNPPTICALTLEDRLPAGDTLALRDIVGLTLAEAEAEAEAEAQAQAGGVAIKMPLYIASLPPQLPYEYKQMQDMR